MCSTEAMLDTNCVCELLLVVLLLSLVLLLLLLRPGLIGVFSTSSIELITRVECWMDGLPAVVKSCGGFVPS